MMIKEEIMIAANLVVLFTFASAKDFLTVCYFPSWAHYREATLARYDIPDVNPDLCSLLIYSFGKLDRQAKILVAAESLLEDPRPDSMGRYREFNNLKKVNAGLRTLLSVGGQNDNGEGFLSVTESDEAVTKFGRSSVGFLRKRGFDGLDIDWEYPNRSSRDRLVRLLKALRKAFDDERTEQRLLLTLAGAAGIDHIDEGYDIPAISRYVDYVNLMTYDYTARTSLVAAFNSPLFSRSDARFNPTLSVNWTVHYWLERGLPASKLVAGVTGVGRRLVLANPSMTDVGSPVTGELRVGDHYRLEGGLAYPEICQMLSMPTTRSVFDSQQQVPFCVQGDNWVGYEDERSVALKIKWMLGQGLGGVMFWSIDQDDFTGKMCNKGKYPLLNAIKDAKLAEEDHQVTQGISRDSPRPEESSRTSPRPEESSRTSPRPEESSRTSPRPEESSRTSPCTEETSRTTPRTEETSRTTPRPEETSRNSPQHETASNAHFRNISSVGSMIIMLIFILVCY